MIEAIALMPDMRYRVSMIDNSTEQQNGIPQAWYDFMQETIRLDKGTNVVETKPRGWHWFWGLYCLRMKICKPPLSVEIDKFPPFDFETVQNTLPNTHWLQKENAIDTEEIYKKLLKTESFKNLYTILRNKDHEKIEAIDFSKFPFKEDVDFSNFIFPINADFSNAKFVKDVFFNNAVFCETADFEKATFQKKESYCKETAKFRNTVFAKIANFRNAIFWGYANFKGAKLKGRAFFQKAQFKCHAPRFYDATFNNEITWAGIKLPNFYEAKVDRYEKNGNDFKLVKCGKCGEYFACVKCEEVIKENRSRRIEENQNAYENTSILLEKTNKYHDRYLFFRAEMRCRRHLEKNVFIYLAFGLYQIFADYGYGIGHAFSWWCGHIIVGAAILMFLISDYREYQDWEYWKNLSCAIAISLSNATPFAFLGFEDGSLFECYKKLRYNNNTDPILISTIKVTQTVIGIMFFFLFLLTLRVRFRLGGIAINTTSEK